MSMIFTKIQFDRSSALSEIVSGEEPVIVIDGRIFLKSSEFEVKVEEEAAIFLDDPELAKAI